MNVNGMEPQHQPTNNNNNKNERKKPYVKITEQPAAKALRFRYKCEGRSAGSIPGANSTTEHKTFPSIEIVGYKGRAVVVVSCVTKDLPYRPHPHNLVGKEGCKRGVCTLEINSETMRAVFSNLGIQCVKKMDIEAALKAREEIRVDPFKTGFSHRFQPSSIDLNSVRLCFQVITEGEQKGRFTQPLPPVVSEPIYDKKAMSDLVICRLSSCSASVLGNTQIILLCEKVVKEDIAVRFFEEKNGHTIWEALGEFQHNDVHKQTAIAFKTPRYRKVDITEPAKVFIQLKRPSDGVTSEPFPFEYIPLDSGRKRFLDLRRNLKRKPDLDIFQEILGNDNEQQVPDDESVVEIIDINSPTIGETSLLQQEQQLTEIQTETVGTTLTNDMTNIDNNHIIDEDEAKRRNQQEIDTIIGEKMREFEQQQDSLQEVVEFINEEQQPAQDALNANEQKINEWMNSNELQERENLINNNPINNSNTPLSTKAIPQVSKESEDKTLSDLLEQVAELDEIYSDHVIRRDTYNSVLLNELNGMDSCVPEHNSSWVDGGQTAMDVEENFDDAATYSSLQIAFKNPISIPMNDIMPPTPPASNLQAEFENEHYDPIEVRSSPAPAANSHEPDILSQSQSPPRPAAPKVHSPHMHITAAEEEKLPPLPPKRLRKQDSNAENRSIEANIGGTLDRNSRQKTPIIIMKTPDQSPPTKRLPQKPGAGNCNTLPKQKKPGFFSKLFSRRKSKSDLSQAGEQAAGSKAASPTVSPTVSREPSIGHFSLNDSNRNSIRSVKSLQPLSLPNSPAKKVPKVGKPVGRSVSSVSGKRPARLNADVVHIPLKGDSVNSLPQNEAYSHASTLTLSNLLDRKTVSALQLADIPICDGNMELVAITDRQSLRNLCEDPAHLRRKRQKTNGDPVHLVLQQQQNQQQNQHQDGRQENMDFWNTPNIPVIKMEQRDTSPQPFGIYRAPPELTPSPQPLSPLNVYAHNTSYCVGTTATQAQANQQLMSPNQQYNTANTGPGGGNPNVNLNAQTPIVTNDYNAFRQQQQYHGNNFGGAAASATNNNLGNLNNTGTFIMHNLLTPANAGGETNNSTTATGGGGVWNLASNHFHSHQHHIQQQQYQQHQIPNDPATTNINGGGLANVVTANNNGNNTNNNNNEHGFSNLLAFDSEQLVRINSEDQKMIRLNTEDLQLSNLSIST